MKEWIPLKKSIEVGIGERERENGSVIISLESEKWDRFKVLC